MIMPQRKEGNVGRAILLDDWSKYLDNRESCLLSTDYPWINTFRQVECANGHLLR